MSRSAWVLFDPVSSESYVLPTNPSGDSGSFAVGKPVVYSAVAASFAYRLRPRGPDYRRNGRPRRHRRCRWFPPT